ncbi:AAA family ATPase [Mariniblastus fucicola]|uniref:Holliday junction DNA helicase RuvB n=1 Tax=Mariniblastus fucicola TaxID=980251 RepID=A0A5B9PN49_9BACT|nr:MoxR family ATPase [Mariniblastus fucicola]QEG23951.1 Holliday junction DNA helicase RuvB [Mariniblastus fucicola]
MIQNLEPKISNEKVDALRDALNAALVGKADVVEMVIACILAQGHLLFDDLPGLGKTTLAKAIASAIGGNFARVQCTPDLLPTDISGFNVFNQKLQEFQFRPGPVFSDLLLADEINRATPRTQSSLFEAMAEWQVTLDNQTMPLAKTFLVLATQNPTESHGVFPLPEAQLDRFAIKLSIGYPSRLNEIQMLADKVGDTGDAVEPQPVLTLDELEKFQKEVVGIKVSENVRGYLVDLAAVTRDHDEVDTGLSPRGLIIWQRMAQAWAWMRGQEFVTPDDIQTVAKPVLRLRISSRKIDADRIIDEVIDSVKVPGL